MNKESAVSVLREHGFDVSEIDGIVYVESSNDRDFRKAARILKKAGYLSSYGWKKRNQGELQKVPTIVNTDG